MEAGTVWIYTRDEFGIWRWEVDDLNPSTERRKVSFVIPFIKPPPSVNDDFFNEAIVENDIYYL